MAEQNQGLGAGGGFEPLTPLGGSTLEDDEKALKKGRGRMIAGMVVAVVAAVAGLAWFVMTSQPSEYGQIGRQINGMRADHFDAFWGCALPRANVRDIRSDQQLRSEITERATNPRAYATLVRTECLVHLDEHVPQLNNLVIPEDLRAGVGDLRTAIESQRTSWVAFLDYLDHSEGAFSADDADAQLTAIARGWYDYKVAHQALNATIREHIDE